ncbi:hypothetical protein [Okeania sp. SIO1I7]|uniref:hypothetical protein n=1 Tax=Okeania sp. SIO1I7 TaxID=2607772 RepID=UPI0013F804CB|nr:hypothetical protein [Okeania sp. SIO1I7]NET30309.1 hypothetical protein [Okeania sp. SIO1I7]
MVNELISGFNLLKVFLLVIVGVVFVTENRKKSLRPLGFLLFAIGNNFLIESVYIGSVIESVNTCETAFKSADSNLFELILVKGVNAAVILWLLLILISEVRIRLSMRNNKQNGLPCRSSQRH